MCLCQKTTCLLRILNIYTAQLIQSSTIFDTFSGSHRWFIPLILGAWRIFDIPDALHARHPEMMLSGIAPFLEESFEWQTIERHGSRAVATMVAQQKRKSCWADIRCRFANDSALVKRTFLFVLKRMLLPRKRALLYRKQTLFYSMIHCCIVGEHCVIVREHSFIVREHLVREHVAIVGEQCFILREQCVIVWEMCLS